MHAQVREVEAVRSILAAATGLEASGPDAAAAAAAAAAQSVSVEYVASGRQFLECARALMAEVPGRIGFCKQRQAQADKLQRLGAKVRAGSSVASVHMFSNRYRIRNDYGMCQCCTGLCLKMGVNMQLSCRHRLDVLGVLR
jgi:hypothetical protein